MLPPPLPQSVTEDPPAPPSPVLNFEETEKLKDAERKANLQRMAEARLQRMKAIQSLEEQLQSEHHQAFLRWGLRKKVRGFPLRIRGVGGGAHFSKKKKVRA